MHVVVGAGLAGLSAAYNIGSDALVLERGDTVGGLCRSVTIRGYTFDLAPHIFFTRSQYVIDLADDLLGDNLVRQNRRAYIYIKRRYVEYPFEVNLHGLPRQIIDDCIEGARHRPTAQPRNFKEWITTTFGEGVAKHYMVPYNQKVWKYDLSRMNMDWMAGRVPAPSVEEMVKGAEGRNKMDYGPNAQFSYPKVGGIGALPMALAGRVRNIHIGSDVTSFKHTQNGVEVGYKAGGKTRKVEASRVISTVPLPEAVKMIEGAPEDVVRASEALVHNSLVCMSIGVDRAPLSDKHWLYFPEERYVFNRVSFQTNFSPTTSPPGKSAVLAEMTFRGEAPDLVEVKENARAGLVDAGILREDDRIEVFDAQAFEYAYVIYDLDHRRNVSTVHRYLKEHNIVPAGRFGDWEYHNMDKSILSGKSAAEEAVK